MDKYIKYKKRNLISFICPFIYIVFQLFIYRKKMLESFRMHIDDGAAIRSFTVATCICHFCLGYYVYMPKIKKKCKI